MYHRIALLSLLIAAASACTASPAAPSAATAPEFTQIPPTEDGTAAVQTDTIRRGGGPIIGGGT
jgi:hypothetical protein